VPIPKQRLFTFLFSVFEKGHFCLHKIAIQGISLWHFHVYGISSSPLFFSFLSSSPSYGDFNRFKNSIFNLYRKYINQVHLLNFLLLPSLSCKWPPLSLICFS
jgi:hypothetical protein